MNKELSLDVKPFKVYGKTLRVIACKKNYINKKNGLIGEFHHIMSILFKKNDCLGFFSNTSFFSIRSSTL